MKTRAFSLIELMIALAILGIIAAFAIPSYTGYVQKTRRADGQTALLDMANRMERYFTQNNTYVGASLANLGMTGTSPQTFYRLVIANTGATTYQLQAIPQGAQANDTICATLTFNELSQKGFTGSGTQNDCWG